MLLLVPAVSSRQCGRLIRGVGPQGEPPSKRCIITHYLGLNVVLSGRRTGPSMVEIFAGRF